MDEKTSTKQIVLGLVILIALVLIALGSIWLVIQWLSDAGSLIDPSIIAASLAGLISVATVVIAKVWEAKYKVRHELRLKKSDIYEEFVDFMIKKVFLGSEEERSNIEKNATAFFKEYQSKLIVWGGEQVVKEFVAWRTFGNIFETTSDNFEDVLMMFNSFDRIFVSMRKDLGHSNKGIKKLDFTRLFVKNLDRDLAEMKVSSEKKNVKEV